MYKQRIFTGVFLIVVLAISVCPVSTQQPAQTNTAKFVLAEWDYPDEYGQGIEMFAFYENSTGSWVSKGSVYEYDQSYAIEWNGSVAIKLRCYTFFNSTLTGASDEADGQNYQKHSVSVTRGLTEVFSQQNFTYYSVSTVLDPLWYYGYEVILNFIPAGGWIYTVSVEYDVYYLQDTDSDIVTATSGSTDAGTPTGDYTDTHEQDLVFFGGTDPTDMYVVLWVELSEEIEGFDYAIYWNGSTSCNMFVYDHDVADWAVLDLTPNGENGPLAWDNDTVSNEDYFNTTHVGFKLWDELNPAIAIHVDYLHIQAAPILQWNTVSTLSLVFIVAYPAEQVFLGNFAFILLGLVLVPASTIYLVYGGREKMSADKFFYFLIAFIIGWAFIIGGVMP